MLSFLFSITAAFLSAFLDALTVTAVLISVAIGFYSVYHRVASGKQFHHVDHDHSVDNEVQTDRRAELKQFRSFLRSLIIHGAVGTALGGVCTLVGEPQNLLIAERAGWTFIEFFVRMAPVTMPLLFFGLVTCVVLEKVKRFGYGATLPESVASTLSDFNDEQEAKRHHKMTASLIAQAVVGVILILSLAFHVASVGLVGLMVIVLLTAFTGVIEEHRIGTPSRKRCRLPRCWWCSLPWSRLFTSNICLPRLSPRCWRWIVIFSRSCFLSATAFCQ